jgi:hypothetical protein
MLLPRLHAAASPVVAVKHLQQLKLAALQGQSAGGSRGTGVSAEWQCCHGVCRQAAHSTSPHLEAKAPQLVATSLAPHRISL